MGESGWVQTAYEQITEYGWRHPLTGDVVQWDYQSRVYRLLRPSTGELMWWGPDGDDGVCTWHVHRVRQRGVALEMWIYTLIGFAIFAWVASLGHAAAGFLALVLLVAWGALWTRLYRRHPLTASAITIVGLFRLL